MKSTTLLDVQGGLDGLSRVTAIGRTGHNHIKENIKICTRLSAEAERGLTSIFLRVHLRADGTEERPRCEWIFGCHVEL